MEVCDECIAFLPLAWRATDDVVSSPRCFGLCYGLGHGLWFRLHLVFRVSVSGSGVCYDVYSLWSPVIGLAVYVFWIGHSCSFARCLRCYRCSFMARCSRYDVFFDLSMALGRS